MEQFGTTINAQLLAKRSGEYTVYVFKNLDTNVLITVTKLPNWQGEADIDVGDEGFLTYIFIDAFKDTWVHKETGEINFYRYSGNYYQSFIPNSHVIKNSTVTQKELLVR